MDFRQKSDEKQMDVNSDMNNEVDNDASNDVDNDINSDVSNPSIAPTSDVATHDAIDVLLQVGAAADNATLQVATATGDMTLQQLWMQALQQWQTQR
jgi:hypothetical protein